ncbi:MAG: hypothetical protein WD648_08640 [Planctomycetaceae bacterium]
MALNLTNLAASMKSLVETACSEQNQQKAKELFQTATKKAAETTAKVKQTTDNAAEATAKKITEWTGRETTAKEVKRAAVVASVAVAAVGVAACMPGLTPVAARAARATSGRNNFGSDFEDQICGAFAENGQSLCFETPYVDSCGQIYPI